MPNISATGSTAALHRTEKQVEQHTQNSEEWLQLLLNELRRLRLGDTSPRDEDVLR